MADITNSGTEILSRPPAVEFIGKGVQPPSLVYFTPDDALFVRLHNAAATVTFALWARIMGPDGKITEINQALTSSTDRTRQTTIIPAFEGFLLNATVFPDGGAAVRRGQCYGVIGIARGRGSNSPAISLLVKGYVVDPEGLLWPGGKNGNSVEGPGVLRSVTGTDPAAGVEISETVPTNARWRLRAFAATYVTDATVANRIPRLFIDDGTSVLMEFDSNVVQAASVTRLTIWEPWINQGVLTQAITYAFLPTEIFLLQGWRIRTSTFNLQAGDNWGAPLMLVEEWSED